MTGFVVGLRRAKKLTAVVAVGFCSANLWSFLHFVAVEHTTCPEHGETLHASPANARLSGTAPERHGLTDAEALDVSSPIALAHEHDPCHVFSSLRERLLVPLNRLHLANAATAVAHDPVDRGEVVRGISLRRLAPKQSPPA